MTEALSKIAEIRDAGRINFPAMALSNNGCVDFLTGSCHVVDHSGKKIKEFTANEYADHLIEHVAPGSYMKSVRLRGNPEQSYIVGPLARCTVNSTFSTPRASALLTPFREKCGKGLSSIDNIEARLIEMVHCAERIQTIASGAMNDEPLSVEVLPHAGRFIGMVEAPRGILIHDYSADERGLITAANLIVATQNNYDAMNANIVNLARYFKTKNDEAMLMNGVEFALRCFDPCLACATHAMGKMPLIIELRKDGTVVQTLNREVNHDH
jgi:F420-non-reducing hydrogenase large subunit